jgi:hypothetical protein
MVFTSTVTRTRHKACSGAGTNGHAGSRLYKRRLRFSDAVMKFKTWGRGQGGARVQVSPVRTVPDWRDTVLYTVQSYL